MKKNRFDHKVCLSLFFTWLELCSYASQVVTDIIGRGCVAQVEIIDNRPELVVDRLGKNEFASLLTTADAAYSEPECLVNCVFTKEASVKILSLSLPFLIIEAVSTKEGAYLIGHKASDTE